MHLDGHDLRIVSLLDRKRRLGHLIQRAGIGRFLYSEPFTNGLDLFVECEERGVVRRLVGYGRFDGAETARIMARLYAAARLYVNFLSFKLKEKRREGAKVIKRYHDPATPFERGLAHSRVTKAVKVRLRQMHRTLDPVALLAEMRAAQTELGERIDRRPGKIAVQLPASSPAPDAAIFAETLGKSVEAGELRATHRRSNLQEIDVTCDGAGLVTDARCKFHTVLGFE